jgi:hypothetical protein
MNLFDLAAADVEVGSRKAMMSHFPAARRGLTFF